MTYQKTNGEPATLAPNDLTPEEQAMLADAEREVAEEREQRFNFDLETERRILSHLLINPAVASYAVGKIDPPCFHDQTHRMLLEIAQQVYADTGQLPTKDIAITVGFNVFHYAKPALPRIYLQR